MPNTVAASVTQLYYFTLGVTQNIANIKMVKIFETEVGDKTFL